MNSYNLKIPAKALLFGEYGLLFEGKALACVLPNLFFEVEIDLSPCPDDPYVIVQSNFFKTGTEEFILNKNNDNFFNKTLLPWAEFLKNQQITIKIKKSFSPTLGFGSSSALITAISYALFVFVHGKKPKIDDKFLWKKIRVSLENVQGTASGYDVGIQLAYVLDEHKHLFWTFQNEKNMSVPKLESIDLDKNLIEQFGCFVTTHIYSDTAQSLKRFSELDANEKSFFANEHKKIAEHFLQSPHFSTFIECMKASLTLAQKQGICVKEELFNKLQKNNIAFKTMGSGYGDCFWVASTKENLENLGIVNQKDIVFSFSDIVN